MKKVRLVAKILSSEYSEPLGTQYIRAIVNNCKQVVSPDVLTNAYDE